jgi:hypothetical protein
MRFLRIRGTTGRVVAALLPALVLAAVVEASTVRGRLDRQNQYGRYPAAGVPVSVYRPDLGQSAMSWTGEDGMYYLYNIPPGNYVLQIWVYPNNPPVTYNITVFNQPYTDIPPILIP